MDTSVNNDERTLREALRLHPSEAEELETDLAIEKMGDKAFDWIVERLEAGALSPSESVRGLRLLSRLTRQFCLRRKGELLDLVMGLAENRDVHVDVRSAAAHIAAGNASLAQGLQDAAGAYGRSPHEVRVQASRAIRRALQIGVSAEVESVLKEALTASRDRDGR
jgi:hypothetical protein